MFLFHSFPPSLYTKLRLGRFEWKSQARLAGCCGPLAWENLAGKPASYWCPDCVALSQQGDPFWSLQSLKCSKPLESRRRVLENIWLSWRFVLRPVLNCSSSPLALRGRGTSFLGFDFFCWFSCVDATSWVWGEVVWMSLLGRFSVFMEGCER